MDVQNKLAILADAAKYDVSCSSSGSNRKTPSDGIGNGTGIGICHSYTPDGRYVSLLKILLTNYCIYDCTYCINRVSSDTPRARFTPEEVVNLTMEFYKRNYIEGLFLSSGVINSPDHTMEQLVRVGFLLRTQHRFGGYIHLKAVPGASPELMTQAGQWADRLSANIELPTQSELNKLAPAKSHVEIETSMGQIHQGILEARDEGRRDFARAGQSTQMIVGATPGPDREILTKASALYDRYRLRRVYYSGFSPIPHGDGRLPLDRSPLVREHRLYQADWLLRFYGFSLQDVTEEENLSLEMDPKLAWALRHREFFPVDVNRSSKSSLLRVPGFGVKNVKRILQTRRHRSLTLDDLRKLRVPIAKAKWFVITADRNEAPKQIDTLALPGQVPKQMSLFSATVMGEL
ncbi:MAG: putative DNA modification/repair radical SAM protein [Bryobacteraceae bacterium]|nr:putative DNA modification/repair radical SAM protein [Bryobacteraceae bacterium]